MKTRAQGTRSTRLVGEEQRGLGEELRGEGEAPALAPGDAGADGADQSVLAWARRSGGVGREGWGGRGGGGEGGRGGVGSGGDAK